MSLIESNYAGFGSGIVEPATGIAYQNRGSYFSLDPAHPNVLAPGKRTLHTLMPGMLLRDGRPWVVHGSMGGDAQPAIFAQVVSALVDGGVDVATAVAAPRWHAAPARHFAPPDTVVIEARFRAGLLDRLAAHGPPPGRPGAVRRCARATPTRSSWSTAGRPAGAPWQPRPTPGRSGCRPPGEPDVRGREPLLPPGPRAALLEPAAHADGRGAARARCGRPRAARGEAVPRAGGQGLLARLVRRARGWPRSKAPSSRTCSPRWSSRSPRGLTGLDVGADRGALRGARQQEGVFGDLARLFLPASIGRSLPGRGDRADRGAPSRPGIRASRSWPAGTWPAPRRSATTWPPGMVGRARGRVAEALGEPPA